MTADEPDSPAQPIQVNVTITRPPSRLAGCSGCFWLALAAFCVAWPASYLPAPWAIGALVVDAMVGILAIRRWVS
ncbi:MAG: hypothetical protein ACLQT7_04810 [Candidatus Dormibacteria bacterium]